jgi:hypothetical protein
MRPLLAALVLFLSPALAFAEPDHAAFDALLARHVKAAAPGGVNRVDYAAWAGSQADRASLDAYIARLGRETPSRLDRPAQFAYWANLYNALTLDVVLDAYPVKSIRAIRSRGAGLNPKALIGPWQTKLITVEGRRLSLDDIEHAVMRPTFKDPRVHYAVNCASIGCPNLQPRAFRAATLEADLDAAARAYVNSARGLSVGANGLTLSTIYRWFKEDFGADESALRAHLALYAEDARAEALKAGAPIAGYAYDWGLNGVQGASP